ncbi:MAG: hypothetical protein IKG93_12655 [Clostridiales bacterium]|jgi:hypothetical protein|nr:hypothetical protein [Clostridiales bacterium]
MCESAFQLSRLIKTGDVVDALTKYGPISLFSIGGLIFLVMAIRAWKEYFSNKDR